MLCEQHQYPKIGTNSVLVHWEDLLQYCMVLMLMRICIQAVYRCTDLKLSVSDMTDLPYQHHAHFPVYLENPVCSPLIFFSGTAQRNRDKGFLKHTVSCLLNGRRT